MAATKEKWDGITMNMTALKIREVDKSTVDI